MIAVRHEGRVYGARAAVAGRAGPGSARQRDGVRGTGVAAPLRGMGDARSGSAGWDTGGGGRAGERVYRRLVCRCSSGVRRYKGKVV